jgi:hypothetical protein
MYGQLFAGKKWICYKLFNIERAPCGHVRFGVSGKRLLANASRYFHVAELEAIASKLSGGDGLISATDAKVSKGRCSREMKYFLSCSRGCTNLYQGR